MNAVFKLFLSMSFSGGLLILALLLGKQFYKNKISRQWQYYIWLVVVLRLLLPFSAEVNLLGKAYDAVDHAVTQAVPDMEGGRFIFDGGAEPDSEDESGAAEDVTIVRPLADIGELLLYRIWLVWLIAALGFFIRKITIYQGFLRYIKAGLIPVSDMKRLDQLSIAAQRLSVKKPVELGVNPLVSSPLLIGFFHPCIVLPSADIPDKDVQYILLHELTHYKRRDMFYKWLVQAVVCLHWFHPVVHLMSREIARACEFSCDEAVLAKIGSSNAHDYGKTLLNAMAAVGKYKEHLGAVSLSEQKQLLKERLGAIMNFKKKSMAVRLLTGAMTLCVMCGAAFAGVYPVTAAANHDAKTPRASVDKKTAQGNEGTGSKSSRMFRTAEKYYEANSLPLFQMVFSQLDEGEQSDWLDRIYTDGNIACFSTLVQYMSQDMLEDWLDRALEDHQWAFQSVLYNALGQEEEFHAQKTKWEEAQAAEYKAVGVTTDGKNYYYKGKLVRIFLDVWSESSCTLNQNPKGTVNIKIVRDKKNKITGVAYLTKAEVTKLFGESTDNPDGKLKIIPVNFKTVAAGKTILLGEYKLSKGDKIRYDVFAKTGKGMQVFFAKDKNEDVVYWSVRNMRQPGEALNCTADFTVQRPAEPGTYKLYLKAADGALGDVKGSISIAFSDAA